MELTINEMVTNLRALNWDDMINYLNNEFLPNIINHLYNEGVIKEGELTSLTTCLELIQIAIANGDVILLCDLLEYEFEGIINNLDS